MNSNDIKKIAVPFVLMLILNLSSGFIFNYIDYTSGYNPHVGIMFISGLLFGPYGALGASFANLLFFAYDGMNLTFLLWSSVLNFAVSYLSYKLWYVKYRGRDLVTPPGFFNVKMILLFFAIIIITGLVYSVMQLRLFCLFEPGYMKFTTMSGLTIFIKYINSAGFYGLVGMVLSKKIDFIHLPKVSKRKFSQSLYLVLFLFFILLMLIFALHDLFVPVSDANASMELILAAALLLIYLTRPSDQEITFVNMTITEKIMNVYSIMIILFGMFALYWFDDSFIIPFIVNYVPFDTNDMAVIGLWAVDEVFVPFILSTLIILTYIDRKLVKPIVQFSQIDDFIDGDRKVDSQRLLEMYSQFTDNDYEVGALARGYSELIESNEEYIANIDKIEREKERIKTELDIAKRIQQANLPTESLENDYYLVDGYSRPAKEVGGDFFDYYKIDDENVALVVGDASGKGVPAALLATITQTLIKQLLQHDTSLNRVLYQLNNQLFEHNAMTMFITLWIGIFNTKTKTLTFSNAGHNPPLIKHGDEYIFLKEDEGIVLGIIENFEFKEEQIVLKDNLVLYTDGITEAINDDKEMYGNERLISFFNDNDDFKGLYDEIDKFSQSQNQFDDMTIAIFKFKR